MAEQFNTRPSSLVAIDDPYAAWCFDEAIYMWQTRVKNAMIEAENAVRMSAQRQKKEATGEAISRARQSAFLEMMALTPDGSKKEVETPRGQFMDPANLVGGGR